LGGGMCLWVCVYVVVVLGGEGGRGALTSTIWDTIQNLKLH
jgi:hypothetical protein